MAWGRDNALQKTCGSLRKNLSRKCRQRGEFDHILPSWNFDLLPPPGHFTQAMVLRSSPNNHADNSIDNTHYEVYWMHSAEAFTWSKIFFLIKLSKPKWVKSLFDPDQNSVIINQQKNTISQHIFRLPNERYSKYGPCVISCVSTPWAVAWWW